MTNPFLFWHARSEVWSSGFLPQTTMHAVPHTRLGPYPPCSQHDGQTASRVEGSTIGNPYGDALDEEEP